MVPALGAVEKDPRVIRSKTAVIEATIELLGERGVADTTIEAIAERSGVAKTTIYRHWDSKPEVVIAALQTVRPTPTVPDTGDLRRDLEQLLAQLAKAVSDSPLAPLLSSLIDAAERDPEFAAVHERLMVERLGTVRGILERGVERGELRADVNPDEVMEHLAGPVFFRRMVRREPITRAHTNRIVHIVLRAYGTEKVSR
jgi:AcrR family transcriptional regulator